jgi:hypothetical protein
MGSAAIDKPQVIEHNAQCINGLVMTINFGHHTTADTSFMLFPT